MAWECSVILDVDKAEAGEIVVDPDGTSIELQDVGTVTAIWKEPWNNEDGERSFTYSERIKISTKARDVFVQRAIAERNVWRDQFAVGKKYSGYFNARFSDLDK